MENQPNLSESKKEDQLCREFKEIEKKQNYDIWTVNIFILKTLYFNLQNIFRSLHKYSLQSKGQIIKGLLDVTVSLKIRLKLLFDNFHSSKCKHNE